MSDELSRVRNLITQNRTLVEQFPDDFGLKLNLYSLEAREHKLSKRNNVD